MDIWWDDDKDLTLDDREYVCEVCWLVHWGPTGTSFCDRD